MGPHSWPACATCSQVCDVQDSGLVGRGQRLNRSDVDIVFAKTRTKGERVLNFEQFVEALDALGQRCNYSLADVASRVLECGGPITRGTVAEGVRFLSLIHI